MKCREFTGLFRQNYIFFGMNISRYFRGNCIYKETIFCYPIDTERRVADGLRLTRKAEANRQSAGRESANDTAESKRCKAMVPAQTFDTATGAFGK